MSASRVSPSETSRTRSPAVLNMRNGVSTIGSSGSKKRPRPHDEIILPAFGCSDIRAPLSFFFESFGTGYDRNDPPTIHPNKLPGVNEKGMLIHYAAPHEDFVWDIRYESGVIPVLAKVYATADLPSLVNLLPHGPKDGGLIVCKGAHLLSEPFHEDMKYEERTLAWPNEWSGFTNAEMAWVKDHGCEWVKVQAEPGDLLVWDSRTPQYNVPASGTQDRLAVYTCYMPVADASQEDLIRKKVAWDVKFKVGTTHRPNALHLRTNVAMRNGEPPNISRTTPSKELVVNERAFKLTGVPYIKV
ncbi:hypothetical protein B0I37DRAFT_389125 [Chaetomium sp. MPI-CAGE-AT-0009]|nr:hypothetical protein B0I37DRAFT_389125 [Chaetomium sp. MPI-CAGE-AT-0009]